MKKIYFSTRARGFFKHLFSCEYIDWEVTIPNDSMYELNSTKTKLLSKIARMKILDYLGVIQVIECKENTSEINGSFNRFLKSKKPYFIYVENPTALYHYSINRGKSYLGKRKIKKRLSDTNLRALICMSKACYSTFETVCGAPTENCEKKVIYPYVPRNSIVDNEKIKTRCYENEVKLLFVAQGIRFISKGALEVIESFKEARKIFNNIKLTMITSFSEVDSSLLEQIREIEGITLLDFNLSYKQMESYYANSTILLQPTSDDSSPLTILEGMKAGLPVLATKLYAIPEMVENEVNGFLTDPKYWFFDENNIPNPTIWNDRKNTIKSNKVSKSIVDFLCEKILLLIKDRDLLFKMSSESFRIANSAPFDENYIANEWNDLLKHSFK